MQRIIPYFLLTILCLLLYIPGIVSLPIVNRDSPHFAQASRQMVQTGNYLQVNFQNKPRHLKPPGIYWLHALSVNAFSSGASNQVWPYRLISLLGGLISVLLTYALTRKYYGTKTGLFAAAMLACSLLLVVESHLVVTDAVLLATMVWMQGALLVVYQKSKAQEPVHWGWPLLFWLGLSAGIVIKGITPLVAALTIIPLVIFDKKYQWLKNLRFSWGLPLAILLILAWVIPVSIAGHSDFFLNMIQGDVAPKLAGGQESHGMPPGYFVFIFTLTFWPASLLFWHGAHWLWENRRKAIGRFLLAWFIPTWLFFEIVPTKLPQYVLPVYPAIAMAIAISLTKFDKAMPRVLFIWNRIFYLIWGLYSLALAGIILYLPYHFEGHFFFWSIYSAALIIIGVVIAEILVWREKLLTCVKFLVFIAVIAIAPVYQIVLPNISTLWLTKRVVAAIELQHNLSITDKKPLISIDYHEPDMVFVLGTHKVQFSSLPEAIALLQQRHGSAVLIEHHSLAQFNKMASAAGFKIKILATIKGFDFSRNQWMALQLLNVIPGE